MSILEAYIKALIEDKHIELIATYVATLPQELQVEWYAKFLTGKFGFFAIVVSNTEYHISQLVTVHYVRIAV